MLPRASNGSAIDALAELTTSVAQGVSTKTKSSKVYFFVLSKGLMPTGSGRRHHGGATTGPLQSSLGCKILFGSELKTPLPTPHLVSIDTSGPRKHLLGPPSATGEHPLVIRGTKLLSRNASVTSPRKACFNRRCAEKSKKTTVTPNALQFTWPRNVLHIMI